MSISTEHKEISSGLNTRNANNSQNNLTQNVIIHDEIKNNLNEISSKLIIKPVKFDEKNSTNIEIKNVFSSDEKGEENNNASGISNLPLKNNDNAKLNLDKEKFVYNAPKQMNK